MTNYYKTEKRLYSIYYNMLDRCNNPKNKRYNRYGGRGISVCKEWSGGIDNFIQWAKSNGYDGSLQLDRRENDGNYEPGNCRWVTVKVNCNNTSYNRNLTFNGKTQSISLWSEELNLRYQKVIDRLKRGASVEVALSNNGKMKRIAHK